MGLHRPLALVSFTLLALLGSGCSYSLHEYQAAGYAPATPTSGPALKASWIHARADQDVVLGIVDNTDYVDVAYRSLLSQCGGDVVAVNTRFSTKLGFLSYTNTIDLQAMCLPTGTP